MKQPFRLALAVLLSLLPPLSATAQGLTLDEISDYLNSLKNAEASFSQINADGSRSTGKLYISRPGQARFEYAPPEQTLVLASGGQVAIFDGKSNGTPEQYPLKRTPLNLVLARNVDLAKAETVVNLGSDASMTWVEAQDPEHPEYGSILLIFTPKPTTLRQWIIRDEFGSQTTVQLGEMKLGESYSNFLFDIATEVERRGN
ncbi:MAG: outer membrane lipoprotein carrier protein LolA [Phaeovulum sp.]|uniref:LolA family protein n=1 Tax=Phaeovulum sp. TaxID=2934796 RepID=UPI0027305A0A|nr:outer membrane lipoprotein carrier protein LolA [Phaeovulum sp.]MDP2063914.1 outer membrane lipoprotein carrier protein LolA [Phaeovulum sp.]